MNLTKKYPLLFIGVLVFAFLFIFGQKTRTTPPDQKKVSIGNTIILVEMVQTPEEKARGLSGRKTLASNAGMLFIFTKDTQPSFWMKDMNFSIDIIWINDGKIVQIDKGVPNPPPGTADSQLPLYSAKEPIDYVLEVNSGFSEKNNFQVGDFVNLSSI